MKIPDKEIESVKNTTGYWETANKKSYITGSEVAFHIAERFYIPKIKQLEKRLDDYKRMYENVHTDMKTLVKIVDKYQEKDL